MRYESESVVFLGSTRFLVLPEQYGQRFIAADTTPSVLNNKHWLANNTGAVTITNFDDGANFQEIAILGDGFTSVANNATVKTNTGALKLLAANKVYRFTNYNGVWVEDA